MTMTIAVVAAEDPLTVAEAQAGAGTAITATWTTMTKMTIVKEALVAGEVVGIDPAEEAAPVIETALTETVTPRIGSEEKGNNGNAKTERNKTKRKRTRRERTRREAKKSDGTERDENGSEEIGREETEKDVTGTDRDEAAEAQMAKIRNLFSKIRKVCLRRMTP